MPRVKKHTARQSIYAKGIKIEDAKTKSGYRRDRSKPADETDELLVEKGQEYYTWKFRYGGQHYSLTPPTARQLTQNAHELQLMDFQDEIDAMSEASTPEDLQAGRDELVSNIESYRDELQERFDNIPYQLQDADAGQILQERIEALNNAASELEGIDLDYDEPSDDDLRAEVLDEMLASDMNDEDEDIQSEVNAKKEEHLQDWLNEKIEEIQSVGFE